MQQAEITGQSIPEPNYDEAPIAELVLGETAYRMDLGFRSAIAISTRAVGTWTWTPIAEAKWDGTRLKCKELEFDVNSALASALKEASQAQADLS
jgi:hypothetical protein